MKIEAVARLKVTAAPISTDVENKFMTSLLKHANLKKFGFVQEKTTITSTDALSEDQLQAAIAAIKKAGFTKPWEPKGTLSKESLGLATKEGTWPICLNILRLSKDEETPRYRMIINLGPNDNLNPNDNTRSDAKFKAVVTEVVKLLKVKALNPETYPSGGGYSVEVKRPNDVNQRKAASLMKAYGKPKHTAVGAHKYANEVMTFKKEYGVLRLVFSSGALSEIECKIN